jgi:hypothetical protein
LMSARTASASSARPRKSATFDCRPTAPRRSGLTRPGFGQLASLFCASGLVSVPSVASHRRGRAVAAILGRGLRRVDQAFADA